MGRFLNIKTLFKNAFIKNLSMLITGGVIAQVIPFVFTPLLTRLYTPDDFGALAFYMSFITIISSFITGKYEQAIPVSSKKDVDQLVFLSLFLGIVLAIFITIAFILESVIFKEHSVLGDLQYIYFLLPLGAFFLSANQVLTYWYIEREHYKKISVNKIWQSTANVFFSVSLKGIKAGGLIFSDLLSRAVLTSVMWSVFIKDIKQQHRFKKIFTRKFYLRQYSVFKRYKRMPLYIVPGTFMNIAAKEVPIIVFTAIYKPEFVGYVMLSQRLFLAPLGIISSSMSQVLLKRMSSELKTIGNCRRTYIYSFIGLAILPIIPMMFFLAFSKSIILFVLGRDWLPILDFLIVLIPFYYIYFISGTLNIIFIAANKQKENMLFQLLYFCLISLSMIGAVWFSLKEMEGLRLFSYVSGFYFLIALMYSFYLSGEKRSSGGNE